MFIVVGFAFVIGILVLIHELGHFMFAKLAGVRVEKFSIGFGPKIFGFRRGETEYVVSLLPLGGYVKMYGEGGSGGVILESIKGGSPAEKAGFQPGDKVVGFKGLDDPEFASESASWEELRANLSKQPEILHTFIIEREGSQISISTTIEGFEGAEVYTEAEYPRSFAKQSIFDRFKIILAGPVMNLIFPFFLLPIIFMIGISVPAYHGQTPVVGYVVPDSNAEQAGFAVGDIIVEVDESPTKNWRAVNISFGSNPGRILPVKVNRNNQFIELTVESPTEPGGTELIGIGVPMEAAIESINPGSPAARAALEVGDHIKAIDGKPVENWYEMAAVIQKSAEKEISLTIERSGSTLNVNVTPEAVGEEGRGVIGITPIREQVLQKYGFMESLVKGFKSAAELIVDITVLLFGFIGKLITGQISLSTAGKTIAGPLAIAQFSGLAAESGIATLLQFTAFISINLGIINLFPIPVLDGGHIIYLTVEAIRRRPLSMRVLEISQRMGFAFLISIMLLAVYNDLARLQVFQKVIDLFK